MQVGGSWMDQQTRVPSKVMDVEANMLPAPANLRQKNAKWTYCTCMQEQKQTNENPIC